MANAWAAGYSGPLPRDGEVVLERADAHDQIRLPHGHLPAECRRVEERRLERHHPDVDAAGSPRAFDCAAGDLAGEGSGRGVQNRHPIHHRNAASRPCGERPQIVAGRTRHAHHSPSARPENGVRRTAVVPEYLPRTVRDGDDRAHEPAGVGPDEYVDLVLGQQAPRVGLRDARAALVVENDQARRRSRSGTPGVLDPELEPVKRLLPLPPEAPAQGKRRAD